MNELKPLKINLQGLNLFEASAGTGKTYTISTLVVRLLTEAPAYSIDKILVVTFTNAATAELRDRIRDRISLVLAELEEYTRDNTYQAEDELTQNILTWAPQQQSGAIEKLRDALAEFDRGSVFTIHSFCQRSLQENAFECGVRFNAELVKDTTSLITDSVYDFWNNEITNQSSDFFDYLERKKVSVDSFHKLAEKRVKKPEATLIPNEAKDHEIDLNPVRRAYKDFREYWLSEDDIETTLTKLFQENEMHKKLHDALNDGRLTELAQQIEQEEFSTSILSSTFFMFLAESGVQKCTKKGTKKKPAVVVSDLHPVFKLGEKVRNEFEKINAQSKEKLQYLKLKLVSFIETNLSNRKEEQNIQSYHDLLSLLDSALQSVEGNKLATKLAARYPVALIDEFQDTDPLQYRIFSKIYENTEAPVFLIGDPKQAIYSFRGADIYAYQQAAADAGSNRYTLPVNWRSDPNLVTAVNKIFESSSSPFLSSIIGFSPVRSRPGATNVFCKDGEQIPPFTIQILDTNGKRDSKQKPVIKKDTAKRLVTARIASHIAQSLDPKSKITIKGQLLHPGQIAVLVRSNHQGADMQKALTAKGVPSVLQGTGSVFQSNEASQLYIVLKGIAEPESTKQVRAALSTDLIGMTSGELSMLNTNEGLWEAWKGQFVAWKEVWNKIGFVQMMRGFLVWKQDDQQACIQSRLLTFENGERRITNILHLIERLHDRSKRGKLGMNALLQWFREMTENESKSGEDEELRLETDALAVKIVTIHSSKGLQYPVVYCPFLYDGKLLGKDDEQNLSFHAEESPHDLFLAIKESIEKKHKTLAKNEAAAENLRLLYVALTRAQHRCLVVFGAIYEAEKSPLGHLLLPIHGESEDGADSLTSASSDEELMENCKRLAALAPECIDVEMLSDLEAPQYEVDRTAEIQLKAKETNRILSQVWRKSSYSGIVGDVTAPSVHSTPEKDHDENEAEEENTPDTEKESATQKIKLDGFVRNAVAGNCFHEMYEHLDFMSDDPEHMTEIVREKLTQYGFDHEQWTKRICEAIGDTLETPLSDEVPTLKLANISTEKRLDEMEFLFPVAHDGNSLSASRLADVFLRHAKSDEEKAYAESLRKLKFGGLRGYLKGFIDLIFEFDGKWYVSDYKSNYLGKRYGDFSKENLSASMRHSHYVLQYHVYCVALYRYLRARMRDVEFDDYFGGVYYLYIKGMHPERGASTGVYFDRPSKELIVELDEVLQGGVGA
ncbi:MAG: exodeoxyribonuclease V subunit beta [Myxococcota bacterium]|nr:exodeoxyribonuclease V subunit beta [Myxococcota bacterium]